MLKKVTRYTIIGIFGTNLYAAELQARDDKDSFLVLSAVALHFEKADERNAIVPGVGWEYSPSRGLGWHAGTFSDSFGSQATYTGINYATPSARILTRDVRLLVGATVLRKQYHANRELQTKIVPLPALEVSLTRNTVLNISGSPEVDYNGEHNNAVMFFQVKMNII